jgi:hypothetical protein
MINNLRPVSRDKLAIIAGGNQELIKFFENLFALTNSLATDGVDESRLLANAADSKAQQALAMLSAFSDAVAPVMAPGVADDPALLLARPPVCDDSAIFIPRYYSQPQGWASYRDTVYTSGAPFTITAGTGAYLPNNAGNVLNGFIQSDTAALYSAATQLITPRNVGDYYVITVRFVATCTNPNTAMDFGIDLGGAIGLSFRSCIGFPRGTGTAHPFTFVSPCYSLDTFVANGGKVRIDVLNGDVSIYNIEYQIARVFSALQGQA